MARAVPALLLAACASPAPTETQPIVFYPAPPDAPRVQFLRSVTLDSDIEGAPSGLDTLLFGERSLRRGVVAPYGVEVHDGVVYVCDTQQGAVLTLDFRGEEFDYVRLDGRARLQKPVNLDIADDGTLYVADVGRRQVVVVDADRRYVGAFGPFGDESRPTDVEVVGDSLYVVDAAAGIVRILDRSSGDEKGRLEGPFSEGRRPRSPTNIAFDSEGYAYVVDTIDCQVYVWDPEGKPARILGAPGQSVGRFARPKGVAFHDDLLFVVDAAFENCQILDLHGEPLLFFGGPGVGPGCLYLPAGIWIGDEGLELFQDRVEPDFEPERLIVVTNQFGPHKVNFYALGRSKTDPYEVVRLPKASDPAAEPTDPPR